MTRHCERKSNDIFMQLMRILGQRNFVVCFIKAPDGEKCWYSWISEIYG